MKKKERAIRLGTVAAMLVTSWMGDSALAQSSVTLYGVADTYLDYSNNNPSAVTGQGGGKSVVKLSSTGLSGPRWGIRGTEDLGGGLSALFVLESGFNVDTGTMAETGRLFNRQAFVGIEGAYGRLTLGRQYTTIYETLPNFAPLYYSNTYEPLVVLLGSPREDNAVKYRFAAGGLTVQGHYAFGEQAGAIQGNAGLGVGMVYVAGPFAIAGTYDQGNGPETAEGHSKTRKAALAGSYSIGPASIVAGYRWGHDTTAAGATALRDNLWWAGLRYELTPALMLSAAFYYDDVKSRTGVVNPPNPKQYVVQGIYSLSKRTDVYGAVAYARNSALNFGDLKTLAAGKESQTGVALGIRHKF